MDDKIRHFDRDFKTALGGWRDEKPGHPLGKQCSNTGSTQAQRRRRWAIVEPAFALVSPFALESDAQ